MNNMNSMLSSPGDQNVITEAQTRYLYDRLAGSMMQSHGDDDDDASPVAENESAATPAKRARLQQQQQPSSSSSSAAATTTVRSRPPHPLALSIIVNPFRSEVIRGIKCLFFKFDKDFIMKPTPVMLYYFVPPNIHVKSAEFSKNYCSDIGEIINEMKEYFNLANVNYLMWNQPSCTTHKINCRSKLPFLSWPSGDVIPRPPDYTSVYGQLFVLIRGMREIEPESEIYIPNLEVVKATQVERRIKRYVDAQTSTSPISSSSSISQGALVIKEFISSSSSSLSQNEQCFIVEDDAGNDHLVWIDEQVSEIEQEEEEEKVLTITIQEVSSWFYGPESVTVCQPPQCFNCPKEVTVATGEEEVEELENIHYETAISSICVRSCVNMATVTQVICYALEQVLIDELEEEEEVQEEAHAFVSEVEGPVLDSVIITDVPPVIMAAIAENEFVSLDELIEQMADTPDGNPPEINHRFDSDDDDEEEVQVFVNFDNHSQQIPTPPPADLLLIPATADDDDDDDDEEQQLQPVYIAHRGHDMLYSECYWREPLSRNALVDYYGIQCGRRSGFVCPSCRLVVNADYDGFVREHYHANAFTRGNSKRDIMWSHQHYDHDGSSNMNNRQSGSAYSRQPQQQQQSRSSRGGAASSSNSRTQQQQQPRSSRGDGGGGAAASSSSNSRVQQQQQEVRAAHPRHRSTVTTSSSSSGDNAYILRVLRSLRGACVTIELTLNSETTQSVYGFVSEYVDTIIGYVRQHTSGNVKIQLYVQAQFMQAQDPEQTNVVDQSTAAEEPLGGHEGLQQLLEHQAQVLDELFIEYNERSSGWVLHHIMRISLMCCQFVHLSRLSGRTYIKTPRFILNKKCSINVKNYPTDNRCFLYSILAILKRDEIRHNRSRVYQYIPFLKELNYKESELPMKICDIEAFERRNPHLAINVIKYTCMETKRGGGHALVDGGESASSEVEEDDNDEATLTEEQNYLSESEDEDGEELYLKHPCFDVIYRSRQYYLREQADFSQVHRVNLLLLNEKDRFHYVAITNLNRLLNCNPADVPVRIRGHICDTCLRVFRLRITYEKHQSTCLEQKLRGTVFTMPKHTTLEFSEWAKTVSPQFVIYADFESMLQVPGNDDDDDDQEQFKCPRGRVLQVHKPIAAGMLKLVGETHRSYEEFYGDRCIVDFLLAVERFANQAKKWYDGHSHRAMRDMSFTEYMEWVNARQCYLCACEFNENDVNQHKVRDHDHFTGKYLGAACNKCNLARRIRKPFLPVIFHNLRGYDMHHLVKYAVGYFKHWEYQCIAQSSEKFLALMVYAKHMLPLRFIDSMQFLHSSLSNLGDMLQPTQKKHLNSLEWLSEEARNGKGVFPYSYVTSREILEQPLDTLPPREVAFRDVLNTNDDDGDGAISITEAQYVLGKEVWHASLCGSLKDYMLVYLRIDVYLLADVFETFRATARCEDVSLDPTNFFSIPGLSWSSALRSMTRPLELLQQLEMYEFFEAGIRGGMTFVNKHYAKKEEHGSHSKELLYVDVNNLYGWALSQHLPCANFQWVFEPEELASILRDLPDESQCVGYLLEVDLHVPPELHEALSDLPPAPVNQRPPNSIVNKLMLTLADKPKYRLHSALLKFYIEAMGVRVTAVHRAIRFEQRPIFSDYIANNTAKRAASTDKFHKDYYKLKNNSLYGKTVENLRRRTDLRLCTTRKQLVVYASKANFQRAIRISDQLVAAVLSKEVICLNRPVYIGQAVLDLSKLRMYRLQYEELARYRTLYGPGARIKILAGDTDSFFLEVINISLTRQLLPQMQHDGLLDTSNYPTNSQLYSAEHENQLGLIKDESAGVADYIEWVFLRPKCYSLLSSNTTPVRKVKGVTRRTKLLHEQYLSVYQSYQPNTASADFVSVTQRIICSHVHSLYTVEFQKRALSILDDKRHWLSQNFSLPYGYVATTNQLNQ